MSARRTVHDPGARRIGYALMTTVTAVVLLFGYRTSTPGAAGTAVVATGPGSAGTSAAASGSAPSTGSPPSTADGGDGASAGSGTFTGSTASTRWGPVQVQITVADGAVTAVQVLQVPDGNPRDVQINRRAVPVLVREALAAQSADIDTVSGATFTSHGYISSLQSALDAAGL